MLSRQPPALSCVSLSHPFQSPSLLVFFSIPISASSSLFSLFLFFPPNLLPAQTFFSHSKKKGKRKAKKGKSRKRTAEGRGKRPASPTRPSASPFFLPVSHAPRMV